MDQNALAPIAAQHAAAEPPQLFIDQWFPNERLTAWAGKFADAPTVKAKAAVASDVIHAHTMAFQHRARAIPQAAKRAFELRDWQESLRLSRERIVIFRWLQDRALAWLSDFTQDEPDQEAFWDLVVEHHKARIADTYQGDVAYAFLASIRRHAMQDRWRFIDYSYRRATGAKRPALADRAIIHKELRFTGPVHAATINRVMTVLGLNGTFVDLPRDCAAIAQRINEQFGIQSTAAQGRILVIDGGFYRNRGAYLVGRIDVFAEQHPFALALLNGDQGIYVDAVILDSDPLRYIFSSSLANFHVTNPNFHELIDFLYTLMPKRPRGLHYSTIGYNHVGKTAVMLEIERHMARGEDHLDYAPGPRGSVAIGFTARELRYVLKIIRDKPTDQYKWGHFPGIEAVLAKYRQVHELNRAGSMLDNVMYRNAALPETFFDAELLAELLDAASENVALQHGMVVFRHLIVQMKMSPLPEFLKTASAEDARQAISSLGRCIKNNAAANVFNKDLDGRNYGVGQTRKVYLFDYDAVEPLTSVKVRSNTDRFDGEEDVPDWFFEDGVVFLPEEIELHLRINDRDLRRWFRQEHGDLLTTGFWLARQAELNSGQIPVVMTYPNSCRLQADPS